MTGLDEPLLDFFPERRPVALLVQQGHVEQFGVGMTGLVIAAIPIRVNLSISQTRVSREINDDQSPLSQRRHNPCAASVRQAAEHHLRLLRYFVGVKGL